jgi:hypothetical protein
MVLYSFKEDVALNYEYGGDTQKEKFKNIPSVFNIEMCEVATRALGFVSVFENQASP